MLDPSNTRSLKILLFALIVGVWSVFAVQVFGARDATDEPPGSNPVFGRIAVEGIDVVDPDGTVRMTIGNRSNFPPVRYRAKAYDRSIDDSIGLIFYEANGDEAGGLIQAQLGSKNQSSLILDYAHQLTDEIGLIKQKSADGKEWRAGLFVSDRRPFEPGDVQTSQGVERILLSTSNNDASLVIADPEGNPRIKIGVGRDGDAFVEMLDQSGVITWSTPSD